MGNSENICKKNVNRVSVKTMIPLGDDNSLQRSLPIVTYILIAINIFVFFLELAGGENFVVKWAFVPNRFLANPIGDFPTLFTSMFMHGGWGHLIGNMLYLWIFGDNVEDLYGKSKYIFFYLICGLAATLSQLFFTTESNIPNLGASGAIAGVLGAYILNWPQGKIRVILGNTISQMPALIVIGFWFAIQFISSMGSLASTETGEGGVAYMAHVGGFMSGLLIAIMFKVVNPKNI
jgi:membrane associated rhomboid family serine protease